MHKWVNRILCLIMLGVIAANAVCAYLVYDYNRAGPLTESKEFLLPRYQGFRATVDELEKEGIIHHGLTVKILGVLLQKARLFKAGEYYFTPGMSAHNVVDQIVEGTVIQRKVTIPEGYTVKEIIAVLNKEEALTGEITNDLPEGSLLPETYLYTRGDSRQSVITQMRKAMDVLLARLWPKRQKDLPIKTQNEALTLASIVEKETGLASERPLVASVFMNRLRFNMRLQSDPTVVYGLEYESGKPLQRLLRLKDLESETAYNTYVIDRLPPTPIACPGKAAIEAVLNPPTTKYLYFVASGKGGHQFAKSLKEHNRNVAAYRRVQRQKK